VFKKLLGIRSRGDGSKYPIYGASAPDRLIEKQQSMEEGGQIYEAFMGAASNFAQDLNNDRADYEASLNYLGSIHSLLLQGIDTDTLHSLTTYDPTIATEIMQSIRFLNPSTNAIETVNLGNLAIYASDDGVSGMVNVVSDYQLGDPANKNVRKFPLTSISVVPLTANIYMSLAEQGGFFYRNPSGSTKNLLIPFENLTEQGFIDMLQALVDENTMKTMFNTIKGLNTTIKDAWESQAGVSLAQAQKSGYIPGVSRQGAKVNPPPYGQRVKHRIVVGAGGTQNTQYAPNQGAAITPDMENSYNQQQNPNPQNFPSPNQSQNTNWRFSQGNDNNASNNRRNNDGHVSYSDLFPSFTAGNDEEGQDARTGLSSLVNVLGLTKVYSGNDPRYKNPLKPQQVITMFALKNGYTTKAVKDALATYGKTLNWSTRSNIELDDLRSFLSNPKNANNTSNALMNGFIERYALPIRHSDRTAFANALVENPRLRNSWVTAVTNPEIAKTLIQQGNASEGPAGNPDDDGGFTMPGIGRESRDSNTGNTGQTNDNGYTVPPSNDAYSQILNPENGDFKREYP